MRCAALAFALIEVRRAATIGDAAVSDRPEDLRTFTLQNWSRN
jgi:hypothetical protein